MATDFNTSLTQDEGQRQLIFQIVEFHRQAVAQASMTRSARCVSAVWEVSQTYSTREELVPHTGTEHAVKLATDFNTLLTQDEGQRQLIFQIVEFHRQAVAQASMTRSARCVSAVWEVSQTSSTRRNWRRHWNRACSKTGQTSTLCWHRTWVNGGLYSKSCNFIDKPWLRPQWQGQQGLTNFFNSEELAPTLELPLKEIQGTLPLSMHPINPPRSSVLAPDPKHRSSLLNKLSSSLLSLIFRQLIDFASWFWV